MNDAAERMRLAELLGALSFVGDLGRGQPMGHVLRTTRIAMALADRLGLESEQQSDVYFTALLVHAGCTAGAADFAAFLATDELAAQKDFCLCDPDNYVDLFKWLRRHAAKGKPLPARTLRMLQLVTGGEGAFREIDQGCSEVGSRIAARMGMSEATQLALYHICETWNGKGPHRLRGADTPLPGRIVNVAMIMEVFTSERGPAAAREAAAARSGKTFDPQIAGAAMSLCDDAAYWHELHDHEAWAAVLALEPTPLRHVGDEALDDFAYALADVADLKSPRPSAHSRRTAELAEHVATKMRLAPAEVALARRAALVHDIGLVGVPSNILPNAGGQSDVAADRVRLHTYYTERILARPDSLRRIGAVAAAHHEHLDGTGYHRGIGASMLSLPARVVAVCSAYAEAEEASDDRDGIIERLRSGATHDPECVAALAAVLGSPSTRRSPARASRPAGLTEREVEVLRLIASGLNLKQTAERLVISQHTARHHLESIYAKAGVSSRAGATLFAIEQGLLAAGTQDGGG